KRVVCGGSIRQTGWKIPDKRWSTACSNRKFESRWTMEQLCRVQSARTAWIDDVRPNDRRFVDLHWKPGNRAGHVRNFRGCWEKTFRRVARRKIRFNWRTWWNGRRATACRHYERSRFSWGRGRSGPDREAIEERLLRQDRTVA